MTDSPALPESLDRLVNQELAPGETIRWAAQPTPRGFPWLSLVPSLFAIPWTLFALFWMATASGILEHGNGFQNPGRLDMTRVISSLFGIPFVLVGLIMFCTPWWLRRRMRRGAARTAYVITNRRAIIFNGGYKNERGCEPTDARVARLLGPPRPMRPHSTHHATL